MNKTLVSIIACATVFLSGMSGTDIEECFRLNEYFNKPPAETREKIAEYERRLAADGDDHYAYLALSVLYSALSAPDENPEKGASEKIVKYGELFEKKEKDNPLAMTYYGLGCSLVSRDSGNPFTKMKMVKKAISVFDKAVDLSANQPREWYVRYMRANFFINLPSSFKKRDVAIADFEYVRDFYTGQRDIEGYMCNAHYNLGEIEKSRGNLEAATLHWKESVAVNERLRLGSREAAKAAERLKLFAD